MRPSLSTSPLGILSSAVGVLVVAACGHSSNSSANSSPASTSSPALGTSYSSQQFLVPFEAATPSWKSGPPSQEQPRLVTWTASNDSRAVRFLLPISAVRPGAATATPVPATATFLADLRSQSQHGAHLTDIVSTTVDGDPATELTATSDSPLNGSLGCQQVQLSPADCFGLQPDLVLRLAVISHAGHTLLVWLRTSPVLSATEHAAEVARFDALLASIRFSDRSVQTPAPVGARTGVDGHWRARTTKQQLAKSPLLMDSGEINDENWGDLTLDLTGGSGTLVVANAIAGHDTTAFTYKTAGDVLTLVVASGETFVMRWHVQDNQLTLARDKSLGVAPTTFLLAPFVRQG